MEVERIHAELMPSGEYQLAVWLETFEMDGDEEMPEPLFTRGVDIIQTAGADLHIESSVVLESESGPYTEGINLSFTHELRGLDPSAGVELIAVVDEHSDDDSTITIAAE